jgi:nucleoside-diphosphate-sugar epimerase
MKYVVTGGAGFIGSNLVRGLLADGPHQIVVVDNLLTGSDRNLDEVSSQIDFQRIDLRDFEPTRAAFNGTDVVFHLAAIPSVPRSIEDPRPSHEANIDGTFNVYLAAKEAGVKRVVYAASSSAYGDTDVLPKVETMVPRPKSPYAVQKLLGEYYAGAFSSCFGLEAVALRFFNVYGPRQDPASAYSGILSIFMKCIITGQAPLIHGDGEQSRDFTYVEDVVGLLLKASRAPNVSGQVYNAGNGNRYTLNMVWDVLQKIAGVKIAARYGPPRAGDVRDSQADTAAAVRDLGHNPLYSLEDGLRKTLDWYRHDLAATAASVSS